MKNLKYEMGNRLSEARKKNTLTQEELAELLDVSVKHISAVERGKSSLSLKKLIQASQILDVSLDYLITGTDLNLADTPFPRSALRIISSGDPSEIDLFLEYISFYNKLRKME